LSIKRLAICAHAGIADIISPLHSVRDIRSMENLAPQAFSVGAENLRAPAITSDLVVSTLSNLSNIRIE
jgi:hypothetical protein